MSTKAAFHSGQNLFKELVRVANEIPETRNELLPLLENYVQVGSLYVPNRMAKGPTPNFDELYDKRQKKVKEEEKADKEKAEKKKKEEEKSKKDKAVTKTKEVSSGVNLDQMMGDLTKGMGSNMKSAFDVYHPDRTDFTKFLEEAGEQILVPTWKNWIAGENPVADMIVNVMTFWTSDEYSPTKENMHKNSQAMFDWIRDMRYSMGGEFLKNIAWDIPQMATQSIVTAAAAPLNLIKNLMEDTQTAEWLVDNNIISYDMKINPDTFEPKKDSFVTLAEFVDKELTKPVSQGKKLKERTWWDKIKASGIKLANHVGKVLTLGIKAPFDNWVEEIDKVQEAQRKNEFVRGLVTNHFDKYVDANKFHMKRGMRNLTADYIKENKSEIADKLKEKLIAAAEGKDFESSKPKKGQSVTPKSIDALVEMSLNNQVAKMQTKLKGLGDKERKAFIKEVKAKDFSKQVEEMGTKASRSIKPKVKTDVVGIVEGKYEGKNFGKSQDISGSEFRKDMSDISTKARKTRDQDKKKGIKGPARLFIQMAQDVARTIKNVVKPFQRSVEGPKKKTPTFKKWVEQKNQAGGFTNPKTKNKVKFDSLTQEDQKRLREEFAKSQGKKASEKTMSLLRKTIRIANDHKELRDDLLPILKEAKETSAFFSSLVRLAHSNEKFRPHFVRMIKAKNLPPDVERYVREGKKQGLPESEAWAVAWSRYCAYKNPGSPHCKQKSYFPGRQADINEEPVEFLDTVSTDVNDQMFSKVVKLAYENEKLRPKLLPLLKKHATNKKACGDGDCKCGDDCACKKKEAKEKYPWDQCIRDQYKRYKSMEIAKKVCGKIRAESQGLG